MARASAAEVAAAKETALAAVAAGKTVVEAMALAGRSVKTHEAWRRSDADYARRVDEVRSERKGRPAARKPGSKTVTPAVPAVQDGVSVAVPPSRDISFEDFRREYLGMDTYDHHRAWISLLETGDVPDHLPDYFTPGRPNRILINTPPFHSKSTVITQEYVLYRICTNPNIRVLVVSKTQTMAKTFLHWIKQRLTDPRWAKLQAAFAPPGGFKPDKDGGEWAATRFYVAGIDSEQKDPTCQALGIGNQVYGARADLAILDDVSDVGNAHQFESQIRYLEQDISSRLKGGKIVVVGTRTGPQDIYSELTNDKRYLKNKSPWSHLRQPAVLEFADDPKDWVTLWPRSRRPMDENGDDVPDADGMFPAWDGPSLDDIRSSISPTRWSLVYQQDPISEDSVFHPLCVHGSTNARRRPGPLTAGAWGHPEHGGEGMYTIAGLDPSVAGDCFFVVGKVDRQSQKRLIENAFVRTRPSPGWIIEEFKRVTEEYGVQEWSIERQGFQNFLIELPEIQQFCASRGVKISPHYTGAGNKSDPDVGVASMSGLFGSLRRINEGAGREVHNKDSLIELPDPDQSNGIQRLKEQLLTWQAGMSGKTLVQDGVMALWFFETAARRLLGHGEPGARQQTHVQSKFRSRRRSKRQGVTPAHVLEGRGF